MKTLTFFPSPWDPDIILILTNLVGEEVLKPVFHSHASAALRPNGTFKMNCKKIGFTISSLI